MNKLRRLDHVAVAVRDTDDALRYFRDRLGLRVASAEELEAPHVRLTYLDAGNAYIQLVEPLDAGGELVQWLDEHGEGVHHICFGVDDVLTAASGLSTDGAPATAGSGRGRVSAFVPGAIEHGVRLECTQFYRDEDVDDSSGFLG